MEEMKMFLIFVTGFFHFFYHITTAFVMFFIPRKFRHKKDITGQVVLITGAGSGVGRSLAIQFSKLQTRLVLLDINKESLLETEKMLGGRSTKFLYCCDVSDNKKVREMAKKVQKEVGKVDILVNNAGIVSGKFLLDLSEEQIVKTMEVNALAHFWTCKAFLPAMMSENKGHIVNIVSVAGKCAAPRLTDYCASKFAAMGFAEALEMELYCQKKNGIKITVVCPAHIDTGLFQGAKLKSIPSLTPDYVAKEVIAGILEDEDIIFIPRYTKYFLQIKEILPRWMVLRNAEELGGMELMKNFTGRIPKENGFQTEEAKKKIY